jgi:predicted nucleic-acid-binding Zn-ribbon protein
MTAELPKKICILDIETEKTNFRTPENSKLALAGIKIYTLHGKRYRSHKHRCFLPTQIKKLEKFLKDFSGIIIGHNILQFDYRVLRQLISLHGVVEKSVDTLAFLYNKRGRKFGGLSLAKLAQANLGKNKFLAGKSIPELWRQGKHREVINYNENDCVLTQELWWQLISKRLVHIQYYDKYEQQEVDKTLRISTGDIPLLTGAKPLFAFDAWERKIEKNGYILEKKERRFYDTDLEESWMGQYHIPFEKCPKCGSRKLKKIIENMEDMTEGQLAEYMAGTWGTVCCLKCGHVMDYEQ